MSEMDELIAIVSRRLGSDEPLDDVRRIVSGLAVGYALAPENSRWFYERCRERMFPDPTQKGTKQ